MDKFYQPEKIIERSLWKYSMPKIEDVTGPSRRTA
jgi:hypothetical protein